MTCSVEILSAQLKREQLLFLFQTFYYVFSQNVRPGFYAVLAIKTIFFPCNKSIGVRMS